jgi:hypothetical protein
LPLNSKYRNNWRSAEFKLVLNYSYVHWEYFYYLVWRIQMRELTLDEIERVSGGGTIGDFAADGGAIGSILGAGIRGTISGAARGGITGAVLGGSFGIGFATGSRLYEYLS